MLARLPLSIGQVVTHVPEMGPPPLYSREPLGEVGGAGGVREQKERRTRKGKVKWVTVASSLFLLPLRAMDPKLVIGL